MTRKIVALLLAMCMLLPCVAFAAPAEQDTEKPEVTITVHDGRGHVIWGAEVIIYNADTEVVDFYMVEDVRPHTVKNLTEGMYYVRAINRYNGYSDAESFYYDAEQGDQRIDMVIRDVQRGTHIRVGNFTRVSGDFFTDMWGNNTADMDVRALLHGQSTVSWTSDQKYGPDTTVLYGIKVQDEKNGDKTYTFTLNRGLQYNDETPITAKDYVFSVLLQSNAAITALGGKPYVYAQLKGHEDYLSGRQPVFSGVRFIDNRTFSLTIDKAYLPYYYELMYVNVTPYPIRTIAPGCDVKDDGKGAYITGPFTAELLNKTLFDPIEGYASHPKVTSGPYYLTDYNAETGEVSFQVNKKYPGNYEGHRPVIEKLSLREIKYDEALQLLQNGEIDVINKGTDGTFIDAALQQFTDGAINTANYLRSGYGFLGFACEDVVTGSEKVRQAIACAMDREAFIEEFLGYNGMPVHSYYGLGQWMAQPYVSTIQDEVTVYEYDPDEAAKLLKDDGWKLDAEGNAYTEGVRYKKIDGELIPLEIRFAQLKQNAGAALIVENVLPQLEALGFKVEVTEYEFADMLAAYYRDVERTFNMNFMASNFGMVFDPYFTFHVDDEYQGELNTSGIRDEKLMKLAKSLRETTPGDEEGYGERWLKLMARYSEVLPTLPIYSNIYYDFFINELQEYQPNALWSWAAAIQYAWIGEPVETIE